MNESEPKDPLDALRPFYIEAKVSAFAYAYEPAQSPEVATHTFDDAALRHYFNAFPKTVGDPLLLYVEALTNMGFRMTHDPISNQPVIFAIARL